MDGPATRATPRWDTVQHLFTIDPGKPPPDHLLLVGELALGLGDPTQLWVGVPTDMSANGYKLLFDASALSTYTLPPASTTVRGGIRVDGTTVTISNGDVLSAAASGKVTIGDTPPASPNIGELWWDSTSTQLFIRYQDPNSTQWVIANSSAGGPSPSVTLPLMDGVATIGLLSTYAKADHIHPGDSTKLGDAPSDNSGYLRRNALWTKAPYYDAKGNVGISTTPPAAASVANITGAPGGWLFGWGTTFNNHAYNAYYDGTNWRYLGDGFAAQVQGGSTYTWQIAPTGLKDAIVPFATKMTLDGPSGSLSLVGPLYAWNVAAVTDNTFPYFMLYNPTLGADAKRLHIFMQSTGGLGIQWVNDAGNAGTAFFAATRNGYGNSTVSVTSPNIYMNGELLGSGNIFSNAGIFPAASGTANGFALYLAGDGSRQIRFTTDNWRLFWQTDGALVFGHPSVGALWYATGGGDTWARGGMQCSLGIIYRNFSGNWIGFGWDGTNSCVNAYIDGGFVHTLASRNWCNSIFATYDWVNAYFKLGSAYTPNQNVDYNQSPHFWDTTLGGRLYCNDMMNASGTFYVANNYAYYLQRNSSGDWIFVEGGVVNCNVSAVGNISARAGMFANPLYSYGNVHWGNDWSHVLGNGGDGQILQFAPGYFFNYVNSTGTVQYILASVARWTQRNDGPMYNAQSWTGGVGPHVDISDERGKQDIRPDDTGLAAILRLDPIRFRRRQDPRVKLLHVDAHREELGFSANAVQRVIPSAVLRAGFELPDGSGGIESDNPTLGLMTTPIVAALVNAVKELHAEIEALKRTLH